MRRWLLVVYALIEIGLDICRLLRLSPPNESETISMKMKRILVFLALIALLGAIFMFILRREEPVSAKRFVEPDKLFQIVEANVRSHPEFEIIVDIDHARLAAKAGSPMPPAHVLIWSDPELEAAILTHNPLAAVDLPLRALAFEDQDTGKAAVIANSYDYVAQRYSLPDDESLRTRYSAAMSKALSGVPDESIVRFASDTISDNGLVTLDSPYDFSTTEKRILESINAQSDTVSFGTVDFTERSKKHGVVLPPMRLLLFGGPGPGGKAMKSAPSLGLDAFCQKMLIWQDNEGKTHVTFNNLLEIATRQEVSGGIALMVINRRIKKTFTDSLK